MHLNIHLFRILVMVRAGLIKIRLWLHGLLCAPSVQKLDMTVYPRFEHQHLQDRCGCNIWIGRNRRVTRTGYPNAVWQVQFFPHWEPSISVTESIVRALLVLETWAQKNTRRAPKEQAHDRKKHKQEKHHPSRNRKEACLWKRKGLGNN